MKDKDTFNTFTAVVLFIIFVLGVFAIILSAESHGQERDSEIIKKEENPLIKRYFQEGYDNRSNGASFIVAEEIRALREVLERIEKIMEKGNDTGQSETRKNE